MTAITGKQLTIVVPSTLHHDTCEAAARAGCTVSEYIRRATGWAVYGAEPVYDLDTGISMLRAIVSDRIDRGNITLRLLETLERLRKALDDASEPEVDA